MPAPIRHTRTRQWTLRTVKTSPAALSAEDIFAQVKRTCPQTGLATVYRNLEFFTKRGEIYRLEGTDGVTRYIGHAYHDVSFQCQRCGQVQQLDEMQVQRYLQEKLWREESVYISTLKAQGLCQNCQQQLTNTKVAPKSKQS